MRYFLGAKSLGFPGEKMASRQARPNKSGAMCCGNSTLSAGVGNRGLWLQGILQGFVGFDG